MEPDAVRRALDDLERAFDEFRSAYAEWLSNGEDGGDGEKLRATMANAEAKLDAARAALAAATEPA